MAFVIEKALALPQQERERLKAKIINIADLPRPDRVLGEYSEWIIDRERNILLSCISWGGRDWPDIAFYGFVFESYLFKIMCNHYHDATRNQYHFFNFHQWLQRSSGAASPNFRDFDNYIPEHLKHKTEQIYSAMQQAFTAYAIHYFKVETAFCHFDDSTVNPDWYPEGKDF